MIYLILWYQGMKMFFFSKKIVKSNFINYNLFQYSDIFMYLVFQQLDKTLVMHIR